MSLLVAFSARHTRQSHKTDGIDRSWLLDISVHWVKPPGQISTLGEAPWADQYSMGSAPIPLCIQGKHQTFLLEDFVSI